MRTTAPFVSDAALPAFAQGEVRSGMNAPSTYTVKHIQKGPTLLAHYNREMDIDEFLTMSTIGELAAAAGVVD